MEGKTNRLRVEGLPVDVTEETLEMFFKNKRRQGGGPVKSVELDQKTHTAVITFKEPEAVDTILSRGDKVEISNQTVSVKGIYDSDDSDDDDDDSDDDNDEEEPTLPQFKVKPPVLPKPKKMKSGQESDDKKEEQKSKPLKSNPPTKPKPKKKKKDLDSCEAIHSESDSEEEKAKATPLKSKTPAVPKAQKKKSGQDSDNRETTQSDSEYEEEKARAPQLKSKTPVLPKAKKKKSGQDSDSSTATQSGTSSTGAKGKKKPGGKKNKEPFVLPQRSPSLADNGEDPEEAADWDLTIKATVIDVRKPKDFYVLYLDDESATRGQFDEETMMLDGVNKVLYVTFSSRQAALAVCNDNHGEENNFKKVEMSTADDFNTYPNLMSVHGFPFDKKELKNFVEQHTGISVEGVIIDEEPRSAIVVFEPDCTDVYQALWTCAETPFEKNKYMITAPVFRSYCLKVTGLSAETTDKVLKWYLSNKRSGGGGKVIDVKRLSESKAIVTLEDEESYSGILAKSDHRIGNNSFQVAAHYPCLECEVYEKYIASSVSEELEEGVSSPQPSSYKQRTPVSRTFRPPQQGMRFEVLKLYSAPNVTSRQKKFQGSLKLTEFGDQFEAQHRRQLTGIVQGASCSYALFPKVSFCYLNIKLEFHERLPAAEVKDRLWMCVKAVQKFLDGFTNVRCYMGDHQIRDFQLFCMDKHDKELYGLDVFFNHQHSYAVVFGMRTAERIKETMDKLFHSFMEQHSDVNDQTQIKAGRKGKYGGGQERQRPQDMKPNLASTSSMFEDMDIGESSVDPEPNDSFPRKEGMDKKGAMEDKKFDKTEKEKFEEKDLILLQKLEFHKHLEGTYDVQVSYNFDELCVVVRYNEENDFLKLKVDLMKKTMEFKSLNISHFSPDQLKVLSGKSVQDKINSIFDEKELKAHFKYNTDDTVVLYYHTTHSTDHNRLTEVVTSQVEQKFKKLDKDTLLVFKSKKGQTFLAEHFQSTDGIKLCSLVKLLPDDGQILIIAPEVKQDIIGMDIDRFIKENKLHTKHIPLSPGKNRFIEKFYKDEVKDIERAPELNGTKVISLADKFTVQGLEEGVNIGENRLSQLTNRILCQDHTLKFFGIKEFLQDREGKILLKFVEDKHKCVILSQAEAATQSSASTHGKPPVPSKPLRKIAQTELNNCNIWFMQGDITALETDAFVNPLDTDRKCSSALGKTILSKGGYAIQKELDNTKPHGSLIVTGAGSSIPCKAIIHVICPVFDSDDSGSVDKLEQSVIDCLNCAKAKDYKSVAFPALGTGKRHGFPTMAASSVLAKTVSNYLTSGDPGFVKIFFCDVQTESLKSIMDRWERTAQGKLERLVDLSADASSGPSPHKSSPVPSPHHHPTQSPRHHASRPALDRFSKPAKDFKHLKVTMELGEITRQKTDIIVITAHKSLDLSRGAIAKAVLKYGGDTIQDELDNNYQGGIQPGEVATTSGGNLECKRIFHACLSHARGGSGGHYLEKLVSKILDEAEKIQATTISIPALGTGNLNYPADVAAQAITDAISKFAHKNSKSSLSLVKLVIYPKDTDVAQSFQAELSGGRGSGRGRRGRHYSDDDDNDQDDDDNDDDNEDDDDSRQASGHHEASWWSSMGSALGKVMQPFKGHGPKTYGDVKLTIKKGDITEEKCDAIISGVKDTMDLSASGAVCKAVLKKCGQSLQAECIQKRSEMNQSGIVMTSAPGLNCNNIFHVSMDKFHHSWDKCIVQVLTAAESQGITSIAMPALGTGAKRADHQRIKKMIFSGMKEFGNSGKHSLTDVRLVLFSQELMDQFVGSGHFSHKQYSPRDQDSARSSPPTKYKTITVSESETFKIYADSGSVIKDVADELNSNFKDAFKEEKDKREEITKLSKQQVSQLHQIGLQHCVRVSVNQNSGLLVMQGFKSDGIREVLKVLHELTLHTVKQHHNQLHQAIKSTFQWQYQQNGRWKDFEPLLNAELETEHKKKVKAYDISDSKGRKYRIDFSAMKEYQLGDKGRAIGDEIDVRRYDRTQVGERLPRRWEKMGKTQNLLLVTLTKGSEEYNLVEKNFIQGGANFPIQQIERIQNKTLYQQYAVKKREIESRNPKGHENEKRLFHGTSSSTVAQINENGFNSRYCGKNATAFGEGVYFATASSYSVGYARADTSSGVRQMYQARVLVGESTPSNSGMKHLPLKPGTNIPYDSGTGSAGMYIIFHDCQAYPEYLISF